MLSKIQEFVRKNHPNKAIASRNYKLFDDDAVPYLAQISKTWQKQIHLGSFFGRHMFSNSEASPAAEIS